MNFDCEPHCEASRIADNFSRFQCYSKITKRRKEDGPNEFLFIFLWKMVNTFRIEMFENVVDSIFEFNPFAFKINPFAFKSIRFLILFFNFLFNTR